MPELSPDALAVWEAFNQEEAGVFVDYGDKLAAALRALTRASFTEEVQICGWGLCRAISTDDIHAIADELEAQ